MPQPVHRPVFLLTNSEVLEANLRRVVEPPFVVQCVPDWDSLKRSLSSAPQTAVCFADAMASVGAEIGLAEGLREVSRDYPLVAVVGCLRVAECGPAILAALQDWGVSEILDLDKEQSASAVRRRLDLVRPVWAQRLFRRALPRTLSARGRVLLEAVADVAAQGGYVTELGDALGVYRGTVTRWCAAAGLPEPRRIFGWIRLLLAADLLDDQERSFESVARISGFTSGASLKSTTKTFTDLSPAELRELGAFQTIARLAQVEFRATRDAARSSKQHKNSWFN